MKRYKLIARDAGLIVGLVVLLTVLTVTAMLAIGLTVYAVI